MRNFLIIAFMLTLSQTIMAVDNDKTFSNNTVASAAISRSATNQGGNSSVTVANSVDCGDNTSCLVVSETSKKVIDSINKDTVSQIAYIVANQFDFNLMTRYAMGSNWKLATAEQQIQLVNSFKQLLIYTYSSALSKFKGAKISIISSSTSTPDSNRPNIQKSTVISQVTLPNSNNQQPIKVEYDLANNTGKWLAYDIKIEDASLVTTYRSQFNEVIQNSKVSGLIKQLQNKVASLQKSKSSDE